MTMYDIELLKLAKMRFALEWDMQRLALGMPLAAPADPHSAWLALVDSKVASGLSRVAAIRAAGKEQPDLYKAQRVPAEPRRARR